MKKKNPFFFFQGKIRFGKIGLLQLPSFCCKYKITSNGEYRFHKNVPTELALFEQNECILENLEK